VNAAVDLHSIVMFQDQNRENINSILKVAVSFKIIMTMSVTRQCFTTQHQTCKTKTETKTKITYLLTYLLTTTLACGKPKLQRQVRKYKLPE